MCLASLLSPVAAVTTVCAAENPAVEFEGAPAGLEKTLRLVSRIASTDSTHPTRTALARAAKSDAAALTDALKSAGYYNARAAYRLEAAKDGGERRKVIFDLTPGEKFTVIAYDIVYEDDAFERPTTLTAAGLAADGDAAGAAIRDIQLAFLAHLWESGFPAAEIVERHVAADFDAATARAILTFKSGPKALFGDAVLSGDLRTKPAYLRKLTTWQKGEEFDRSKILTYRDRLAATGLFSSVNVAPGAPQENGEAPVLVTLEERKRRTIGAGLSYSTAQGPGARIFFENRNIFRRGENLRIELRGSELEQAVNFDIARPMPTLPGELFGAFTFRNQTTDAFDARSVGASGGVAKRWLDDRLETRASLAFETSKIKQNGTEERTNFLFLPLSVVWDNEDDALDPRKGVRASWTVTPYTGSDTFVQSQASARARVLFGKDDRFTLAGRVAAGATFAESLSGLPLNRRYFSGGGGSVRGFAFQEAGPLDEDGDPVGGRSLLEGSIEARADVTRALQAAAFIDAGSVSDNALPSFSNDYFVSVGAGVRYKTPIGPIRADVAFPLNPRESDRSWQLLIAIGQPF
ncbi:MAG: BamA/TamA family outer membrane protein [Pseudomonadota bacterium]